MALAWFPCVVGTPDRVTEKSVLHDPLSTVTYTTHKVFGNVMKVRQMNSSGAWFRETGEFIGFLERYTPR